MQSGAGLVRGAVVATDNGQPVSNSVTSFSTCKEKIDNTEMLTNPIQFTFVQGTPPGLCPENE